MSKLDPKRILPTRPFLRGIATAFDIYGTYGLQVYEKIHDEWSLAVSQPSPSADESIIDSIAVVNGDFMILLAEHET